jgi:hypothetical protein
MWNMIYLWQEKSRTSHNYRMESLMKQICANREKVYLITHRSMNAGGSKDKIH